MRLLRPDGTTQHLSYCSNIHPAESWQQVRNNLQTHLLPIRSKLAADEPFGIGLRLSAESAEDLSQPETMREFQNFLTENNCYVFTINGFPYGPFHGTRVKEDVYLPDWKDQERLRYTNQLADIFAQFLPGGMTGSISTVPGAFKARVANESDVKQIATLMIEHVAHLHKLEQETGSSIVLALEPEPCCFLETIEESVGFFENHLFSETAILHLQSLLKVHQAGIDYPKALALLQKHLTLCFDLCHAAVEFENPQQCINILRKANISIGKIQISAGLRLQNVDKSTIELLKPFDDNVYLHQVVEQYNGDISRYTDLPEAFAQLENSDTDSRNREWRVHFHVPIFLDELGKYSSTQFFITEFLALHKQHPVSDHHRTHR